MTTRLILRIALAASTAFPLGCATTQTRLLDSDQSQLQLRSIQSRAFDTVDKTSTLRSIIGTLQDLGFVVDKADDVLGSVSATKLDYYSLRITVSVRPRGTTQLLVRANAEYANQPVTDPKPYQDFFAALSKAMFLDAHEVN
jgi:hypothetical protein